LRPEDDERVGVLWDFDNIDGVRKRLFDCALIRVDHVSHLTGEFHPVERIRKPYPTMLGTADLIREGSYFYLIGARTREKNIFDIRHSGASDPAETKPA
jgi:hypothetical protein